MRIVRATWFDNKSPKVKSRLPQTLTPWSDVPESIQRGSAFCWRVFQMRIGQRLVGYVADRLTNKCSSESKGIDK